VTLQPPPLKGKRRRKKTKWDEFTAKLKEGENRKKAEKKRNAKTQ